MTAQTMWISVHKMWNLKRYASLESRTGYQKDGEDFDRLNWSSISWTWNVMPSHRPKHSDISMIHIEILNGFWDMRYWVKTPYQLKYQDQSESFKIQDVNTSTLSAQHQDLMNQKDEICQFFGFYWFSKLWIWNITSIYKSRHSESR
jgi:hypothetical protein